MCYEIDYMFFAEQKKIQEKQEQRAGVINKLLNEATQAEPAKGEDARVNEVASAK